MITTAPKGTLDVLPRDSYKWQYIEEIIRRVCALYAYGEIRVPTFEHTELFLRSVGDTTDIVQKEMYTFEDKGGRSITLKPEGTAGVARAFVEHGLFNEPLPQRMYYLYSPVFRYERPQAGRFREHHQFGVEVYGAAMAEADAEVILLARTVLDRLGITGPTLNINSIGCPNCRGAYLDTLKDFLRGHAGELCSTCRDRLERNPLRVLDCKVESCRAIVKDAPKTVDHLCEDCAAHFDTLKALLDGQGVAYTVNPFIVRGLDYYTRTVFEFISTNLGAQGTVCGGGRYDGLLKEVGGMDIPGIGFGMGMERLVLEMEATGVAFPAPPAPVLYIAPMGEEAQRAAFQLAMALKHAGIDAQCDAVGRSLKAQMKYANKLGFQYVAVVGEDEMQSGMWKLKRMDGGEEQAMPPEGILEFLRQKE